MNKMKKIGVLLVSLFVLFNFVGTASAASADLGKEIGKQLGSAGTASNLSAKEDPRTIAVNIITVLLALIGTIFLALTVYAGFLWMTAGGSEEAIEKSKKLLFQGVIGLAIVLSAYGITQLAVKLALGNYDNFDSGVSTIPKNVDCDPITNIGC